MEIFCRKCDGRNDFQRNWIESDDECAHCGARGQWRTINEPKVEWVLTENDKKMLRKEHIGID